MSFNNLSSAVKDILPADPMLRQVESRTLLEPKTKKGCISLGR